ncbi:MAG: hypothetical protein HOD27_05330, partial [Betaproteobacteria bacterium]|nr:hypothetical protein [Betaproteobacteria bacterium]
MAGESQKLSKEELREDEFVEWIMQAVAYVKARTQLFAGGVVGKVDRYQFGVRFDVILHKIDVQIPVVLRIHGYAGGFTFTERNGLGGLI